MTICVLEFLTNYDLIKFLNQVNICEDDENDVEEIHIRKTEGNKAASGKGSSMTIQKSKNCGAFSSQSIERTMSMGK